jgi:hypothetical protein
MPEFNFDESSHIYTLDGSRLDSVTGILRDMGFVDAAWFTEESRIRGKYVHKAIHYYTLGELDEEELDPRLVPYLEGWKRFVEHTRFLPGPTEQALFHPQKKYAGTPDIIGQVNGYATIIDVKSGAINPVTAIQLAAYEDLVIANYSYNFLNRIGLQVTSDGKYKVHSYKDRRDSGYWQAILSVHNLKKNMKRR